jgi:hypothetical protein
VLLCFRSKGQYIRSLKNVVAINSQTSEIDFFSRSRIRMFCIKIEEKDIQVGSHLGKRPKDLALLS